MKPIPIKAGEEIAKRYDYDQVVIVARKIGDDPAPHGEHVTTYGRNKAHCAVAAHMGNFFKYKLMDWPAAPPRVRCSECDNGVKEDWTYCPYCGAKGRTEKE